MRLGNNLESSTSLEPKQREKMRERQRERERERVTEGISPTVAVAEGSQCNEPVCHTRYWNAVCKHLTPMMGL